MEINANDLIKVLMEQRNNALNEAAMLAVKVQTLEQAVKDQMQDAAKKESE